MTPEIINADPFCPARLSRVLNRGRATDKFFVELQKPDSEEWMEIPGTSVVHGSNYALVPNYQVHEMAQKVMAASKMNFQPIPTWGHGHSAPIVWSGKHYLERWYSPDVKFETPQGGQIMMGMQVCNSYDKSCQVGLSFFAMHVACSNQFHGRNLMGKPFQFAHIGDNGNLGEDFQSALDGLRNRAACFASVAPKIQMLSDTHVESLDDFLGLRQKCIDVTGLEFRDKQLLDELHNHAVTKGVGIDVGNTYGKPSSFWAIGNAFTAITTHAVGGLRGQEHSSRMTDFLLKEAELRAA